MHEQRIIEAFKSSEIKKMLLIDDAYDHPPLDDTAVSQLIDYLESSIGRDTCDECHIEEAALQAAISAAHEGNLDSEELENIYHILYTQYIQENDAKFDPGGRFANLKKPDLVALLPLRTLLSRCGQDIDVQIAGLKGGTERYREFRPQVLFLDYYLENEISTVSRQASLDFLKQVVQSEDSKDVPAIVLMSSRQNLVGHVDRYRIDAGDERIMSLRFQFLNKESVRFGRNEQDIVIDYAAVDALLDTSQGYLFGSLLQQALTQWKQGAERALNNFMKEIGDLEMKDFAYLLRFRLREEGQPLSEYVEWLFGEYMKRLIDTNVNWDHSSFSKLNNNAEIEDKIEGAFDGPSINIAKFFHSVRVNDRPSDTQNRYQLGDLYAQIQGNGIRAVITPDCDLVLRDGNTKATRILTIGGLLHTFDQHNLAADDFILYKGIPYSILWNLKDIETFPIVGQKSLRESDQFEFLGTLRPLYAQETQRRALNDLSRVGLPVAPAFGINVVVTAWMRTKDPASPFENIIMEQPQSATIIPLRREQKGGPLILLRRRFVNQLID